MVFEILDTNYVFSNYVFKIKYFFKENIFINFNLMFIQFITLIMISDRVNLVKERKYYIFKVLIET